jgi:hypothetical protein
MIHVYDLDAERYFVIPRRPVGLLRVEEPGGRDHERAIQRVRWNWRRDLHSKPPRQFVCLSQSTLKELLTPAPMLNKNDVLSPPCRHREIVANECTYARRDATLHTACGLKCVGDPGCRSRSASARDYL